jgi:hypothetical protein
MKHIGSDTLNTHLELSPSCVDQCMSLLLQHKGAGRPRGENSELAGTHQQRREVRNNIYIMYKIHPIDVVPADLFDVIPHC